MKIFSRVIRLWWSVAALAAVLTGCATGPRGGHATVEFQDPARFSDLQIPGMTREQTAPVVLSRLQEEVDQQAQTSIPAGYTVHLVFTEIDEEGVIPDPAAAFPIRITGDNTPAVISFNYTINGPSGEVVKSGSQRIVQTPENLQPFMDDDSPVPLIEYMIENWLGALGWELSHPRK
jgi:hypothetical protein